MAERSYSITTTGLSTYLATVIKNNGNGLYFAIGIGNSSWDDGDLPNPPSSIDKLVNESYRVQVDMSKIVYVNPSSYTTVVEEPTSTIRIEVNINKSEYPGVLREYGLFGVNATSEPNSGTLIQYADFDKREVPSDAGLKFWIYLSL